MSVSIAALIDNAGAGATVTLPPGVYEEALVLTRPITLVAQSPGHTTIRSPAGMSALRVLAEADLTGIRFESPPGETPVVEVLALAFMMECDIDGGGTGIRVAGVGAGACIEYASMTGSIRSVVVEHGAWCHLIDTDLKPAGPMPADVNGGSALVARSCHIAIADAGGIRVMNASRADFISCVIDSGPPEGPPHNHEARALLIVASGSHARLIRTVVRGGVKSGVFFHDASGRLRESTVEGNGENGVCVRYGSKVVMVGGSLSGNAFAGIAVADGSKAALRAVAAAGNREVGLFVDSGGLLRARDCLDIARNEVGVYVGEASMRLRRCDLRGNVNGPIRSHSRCDFQASDTPMHGTRQVLAIPSPPAE